ncbi:TRAF3-interacting protein 1 [Trichinella pseudospiralis]|uniref:TRAF3-interacting protein 1 n=1 Tax=Trichinella pseudospiralis TaxID=6337 RepID=A0A0V1J096_TRIPS|nr:TRAF3-interacting protein 1 [Trichinella pseudospiralis]KRZ28418.1 TRAF3-interacting protein 1 [Trichinella pseudospiralis]
MAKQDNFTHRTIRMLAPLVEKPQLTEKLLMRPPFSYLRCIITAVVRSTGFLSDLFTDDELESAGPVSKEFKIQFLNKLISAVEKSVGRKIQAKPSKIVAGLESDRTNELLQAFAEAATKYPSRRVDRGANQRSKQSKETVNTENDHKKFERRKSKLLPEAEAKMKSSVKDVKNINQSSKVKSKNTIGNKENDAVLKAAIDERRKSDASQQDPHKNVSAGALSRESQLKLLASPENEEKLNMQNILVDQNLQLKSDDANDTVTVPPVTTAEEKMQNSEHAERPSSRALMSRPSTARAPPPRLATKLPLASAEKYEPNLNSEAADFNTPDKSQSDGGNLWTIADNADDKVEEEVFLENGGQLVRNILETKQKFENEIETYNTYKKPDVLLIDANQMETFKQEIASLLEQIQNCARNAQPAARILDLLLENIQQLANDWTFYSKEANKSRSVFFSMLNGEDVFKVELEKELVNVENEITRLRLKNHEMRIAICKSNEQLRQIIEINE